MFTAEQSVSPSFDLFTADPPAIPYEPWQVYEQASPPRQAPSTGYPQLAFPEGLYGFGSYHSFVIADVDPGAGLFALVASDDVAVQLLVVDAALAVSDYPLEEARAAAGMSDEEVAVALVVVHPADGGPMTVNLRAPVVIGLTSHRGVQVILGRELPLTKVI